MMRAIFNLCLSIFILQLDTAFSKVSLDNDCYAKDNEKITFLEDASIVLSFFITHEVPLSIHILFDGRRNTHDFDLITIKPESGTLYRKRDGKQKSSNFTLDNPIPVGWNSVNITTHGQVMNIGEVYSITGLEYTISDISIAAKYFTKCLDKTPMWKIEDSEAITIPLTGLSHTRLTLVNANESFLPLLTLNGLDVPLSYDYDDEELRVRKSNTALPPNRYHIQLRTFNNIKSIYTRTTYAEFKLLLNANMKEDLSKLSLRAIEGSFHVILNPFQEHDFKEDLVICKQCLNTNIKPEKPSKSENERPQILKSQEPINNNNSSSAWKIIISVSFVFIGVLISIIYIAYKTKKYRDTVEDSGIEEGTSLLMNKTQVHVKDTIRATNIESHGENNQQMKPHVKEICKIKLKTDETISSKKKVGELENNKPTKVILVVGQTGSGKSSFINAMLNFIYGVVYEDSYRFKLIDDMDKQSTAGTNNTDEITSYYIPYMSGMEHDCNYIFVDTPGFGDSRGIDEDKKWNNKFQEFLNKNPDISEVDGICFVIKAAVTRMTLEQQYIIDGLFSMFGRDIKKNIYVTISHSDGLETNVLSLLEKSGLGYKLSFKFNSKGFFNDITYESGSHEDIQKGSRTNWKLTVKNMDFFFKDLNNTAPVDLSLTNIVLEENKDIAKIKDELLELSEKEDVATGKEKEDIQSKIEQNQKLLMLKLDEAKKLSGRLENIPYSKENPLVVNDYIDILIRNEEDKLKISKLQKLKARNTKFKNLLNVNKSYQSLLKFILGEKTEKTD